MAANVQPIFSRVADIQWSAAAITAANTTKDGSAGTVTFIFTADATNGGFVEYLIFQPVGTNVKTMARIFINNGSVNTVAANNAMIGDKALPATTLDEDDDLMPRQTYTLGFGLPPGYRIFVTLGTAVAAGYMVACVGGKY